MPVRSTRRGQRREGHRAMGKKLPLRPDGSAAPCGRAGRQREQCDRVRKRELVSCLGIREVLTRLERKILATVCITHPENCLFDLVG